MINDDAALICVSRLSLTNLSGHVVYALSISLNNYIESPRVGSTKRLMQNLSDEGNS